MKPKEVTDLLGIDRERIKTLKREGVFTPEIKTKGISNYTEGDVEQLRKLTILNKAGLTCSDIRKMQNGEWSMSEAIEERTRLIKEKIEQYMGSLLLAEMMTNDEANYDSLDVAYYWNVIEEKEREGVVFIDNPETDYIPVSRLRAITCPYCGDTQEVDLEDFEFDQTSNGGSRENDMGSDIVYYFDSDEMYECSECGKVIRISGWIREYPIGVYDAENISVEPIGGNSNDKQYPFYRTDEHSIHE